MIKAAFLQLRFWKTYHASSPYRYFFTAGGYHGIKTIINMFCITGKQDIKKINFDEYEFVIVDQGLATYPLVKEIYKPKMFLALNVHAWDEKAWNSFNDAVKASEYTLTPYPFAKFPDYVPFHPWKQKCETDKFIFFPHHVADTDLLWDFDPWERNGFLLSGLRGRPIYDYRADVEDLIKSRAANACEMFEVLDNSANIEHENYLVYLRKFVGAITCNSSFGYTVGKYTEIPSQGTVLVAPPIPEEEAEIMGFKSGQNCMWVQDPKKVPTVCEVLNNNRDYARSVAKHGLDLIAERHTSLARFRF